MTAQIDSRYRAAGLSRVLPRLICYTLFEGRPLTTRGRWINPFVLGAHRLHGWLPALRDARRPIFITGIGRSGTTILGTILSLHRSVALLNEPKALWQIGVGREDVIGSYDRGEARYSLGEAEATPAVNRRLHRLYGACLFWTRRRRIVEKNAECVHRIPFLRSIFPDARFLIVTRNGRDVCQSIDRWSKRHGSRRRSEVRDWWGADGRKWRLMVEQICAREPSLAAVTAELAGFQDPRQRAAVEWSLAMRVGLEEAERSPQAVKMVRLESLATRPLEVLAEITRFGDLDEDPEVIRYATEALVPPRTYDSFDIEHSIEPLFRSQMTALGYEA